MPAASRSRSRSSTVSTAATAKAISQAATTRAVSGVSGHGHNVLAVAGATNRAAPTMPMTSPCSPNAATSQDGTGSRRSGSAPGSRCWRAISPTSATGTTT